MHYEPDNGPRYELLYGPRYRSSYTAMHAGPTTATATPLRWTGRRTTLDTYIWRSRPRAPHLQPGVMTPTSTAGHRTRSAEVCYAQLDWTKLASFRSASRAISSQFGDSQRLSAPNVVGIADCLLTATRGVSRVARLPTPTPASCRRQGCRMRKRAGKWVALKCGIGHL
jgi:hypothetical protein